MTASATQLPLAYRPKRLFHSERPPLRTAALSSDMTFDEAEILEDEPVEREPYPSPLPERALFSAKLAALHSRLSLSEKIPLQTLARALVDPSADPSPNFNNANLAFLGQTILAYHVSEWLLCRYPRLPMGVLYEAMRAYAGHPALHRVSQQWGVDSAAVPGEEVDPGLLQWSDDPTKGVAHTRWGYVRKEHEFLDRYKWRRGMSSRIVMDDEFGDAVHARAFHGKEEQPIDAAAAARAAWEELRNAAHAAFVRAAIGAVYIHCGREAAKSFVKSHILARKLDFHKLFRFRLPTRELARLCAREGFEAPVARLLSETGRLSRTPVFVVGIYSGKDKLGEGAGPSLDFARIKAAINGLQSWYLYSPGQDVRVPSDMLVEGAKPWTPAHVDIGEVIC
jgi:dsRNA-specific ribonuclease